MSTQAIEPINNLGVTERVAVEAQQHAQSLEDGLRATRVSLTADMIANMDALHARIESACDSLQAYFFTVDGVLFGKKIHGALFAGECILVYALSEAGAKDLANRGLRRTKELIIEEYETRNTRLVGAMNEGMVRDPHGAGEAGGRRVKRQTEPGEALGKLPFLKAMLEHEIGGLPWKY